MPCAARHRVPLQRKDVRAVARLFPNVPTAAEIKKVEAFAAEFVDRNEAALDSLMDHLSTEIALDASTRDLDELMARLSPDVWHRDARREVLVNYFGFPFWTC